MKEKKPLIHKDMVVADIVGLYPESADIIMGYGLHCISCHYNAVETLEQGILGHGYSEDELNALVNELNDAVSGSALQAGSNDMPLPDEAEQMAITITPKAIAQIKKALKQDQQKASLLRLEVTGVSTFKYEMNFIEPHEVDPLEKIFSFSKGAVRICVSKKYYKKINGLVIDYLREGDREGFKMKNPNVRV